MKDDDEISGPGPGPDTATRRHAVNMGYASTVGELRELLRSFSEECPLEEETLVTYVVADCVGSARLTVAAR